MLIFYTNFGQGGANWYVGPLLMLLPLLLPLLGSGILSVPFSLLSLLLGGGTTFVWTSSTGWQATQSSAAGSSGILSFVATLLLTVLFFFGLTLARQMRRHGVLPTLRRLLITGWHGGMGWQPQRAQRAGQQRAAGTQQERFEAVTKLMQGLPTEMYHSSQELERMPVAQLKELLRKAGVKCQDTPLEKRDLVDCLQKGANSSSTTCSICCEDYASGDVLRGLRCGHRFHLECIDRWLLASTDYSRPPACPMCNSELGAGSSNGGSSGSGGGGDAPSW